MRVLSQLNQSFDGLGSSSGSARESVSTTAEIFFHGRSVDGDRTDATGPIRTANGLKAATNIRAENKMALES